MEGRAPPAMTECVVAGGAFALPECLKESREQGARDGGIVSGGDARFMDEICVG